MCDTVTDPALTTDLPTPTRDFTVVIPVYYNEGELWRTFRAVKESAIENEHGWQGEIVFVDDGSRDGSWAELQEIQQAHPDFVRIFRFSRNFGHYWSRMAGFRLARGEFIFSINADLQDPPELIMQMLTAGKEEDYHIVIAERTARDESAYRKITSRMYYGMIRALSFPDMPKGGFDFFMFSARVRDILFRRPERNSFLQAQLFWSGFPIKSIPYKRMARQSANISRWTFKKKLKLAIDVALGFSFAPVRAMTFGGGVIAGLGALYGLGALLALALGAGVSGVSTVITLLLVLGGMLISCVGIVGEYVWRALDAVKHRPDYIIAESVE